MRAAPTQVSIERRAYLSSDGIWVAFEQGGSGHQDSGKAIAALARLLVKEGIDEWMPGISRGTVALKALDGSHHATGHGVNSKAAGIGWLIVQQHDAGAALLLPATEARPGKAEFVAKHDEQGGIGRHLNPNGRAIDREFEAAIHLVPRWA